MSLEVFTQPWAQEWARELKSSDAYRQAALKWEGSLLIEMEGEAGNGSGPAVLLDLWHGDCRGARLPLPEERESADYVIGGDAGAWRRILAGEIEPIFALMSGKLKLRRGSLAKLTPFLTAAQELVRAAGRIDSHFPEAGNGEGSSKA